MPEHLRNFAVDFKIDATRTNIPQVSDNVVVNALNTVYLWTGILAVIVIIVAGFYYVTSANNQERLTRAKNAILYAVIGLIVVLMAFVITKFVIGSTGTP